MVLRMSRVRSSLGRPPCRIPGMDIAPAGDTLFFPANTTGVRHICEALRKVYVVFASQA